MEVSGSCLQGPFNVGRLCYKRFDGGRRAADEASKDVISYASHQDPQLLFVGGLRVGASDQAQDILDETGDGLVCALGSHSKKVLGPLPSILVSESSPQLILAGGPRDQ